MKANDGSGDIKERDEWETPEKIFDPLDRQYNFRFDCCATYENTKTENFSSRFEKLDKSEEYIINPAWMNPPFSKAEKMFKEFFKKIDQGVAIYRCDNLETKLYQNIILEKADWIFIIKGRVNYKGLNGSGARFPSALIGVGLEPPENISGHILSCEKQVEE